MKSVFLKHYFHTLRIFICNTNLNPIWIQDDYNLIIIIMRTSEILATIAVVGSVATFALMNTAAPAETQNFLGTPITEAEREFINYITKYNKRYGTKEEYNFRLGVFTTMFDRIHTHNKHHVETHGFKMAFNEMSDWTETEYKSMLGLSV